KGLIKKTFARIFALGQVVNGIVPLLDDAQNGIDGQFAPTSAQGRCNGRVNGDAKLPRHLVSEVALRRALVSIERDHVHTRIGAPAVEQVWVEEVLQEVVSMGAVMENGVQARDP